MRRPEGSRNYNALSRLSYTVKFLVSAEIIGFFPPFLSIHTFLKNKTVKMFEIRLIMWYNIGIWIFSEVLRCI